MTRAYSAVTAANNPNKPVSSDAWNDLISKVDEVISVKDFGAVGDGVADDQPAIQDAIDYANGLGGGEVVLPKGIYLLGLPLELSSGVSLVGQGLSAGSSSAGGTVLKKTNAAVSTTTAVDCVVCVNGSKNFRIENITFSGNRTSASDSATILAGNAVITASSVGLYMTSANNFVLSHLKSFMNQTGFKFVASYIGTINSCGSTLCEGYGWELSGSCTSLTFNGCGSYACGGHASIISCVYITWNSPYADLIDRGRLPYGDGSDLTKDPFAASPTFKSGGDYANPVYSWDLSGSKGIVINGPGQEGGYSKWLYAEGTHATINSPYSTFWKAQNASWRWVQLRGTGKSVVTITGPYGFSDITKGLAASAIYVENSSVQKLFINGKMRLDGFTGTADYSAGGIVHADQRKLVEINQSTMRLETTGPFIKGNTADTQEVVYTSGTKRLKLVAGTSGAAFSLPLAVSSGMFRLDVTGFASGLGSDVAFRLNEYTTTGTLVGTLKTFTATGSGTPVINEWAYVAASGSNVLRLDLVTYATTEIKEFTKIELTHVPAQA